MGSERNSMKAYTVSEQVRRGIDVSRIKGEGPPLLRVGEASGGTSLPLSQSLSAAFDAREERIVWARDALALLQAGTPGACEAIKLAYEEEVRQRPQMRQEGTGADAALRWAGIWADEPDHLVLNNAETAEGRITKEPRDSSEALVLVNTLAPPGGRLWLEGTGLDERVECTGGRASVQWHRHAFPSPGCRIEAVGHGPEGEPWSLIRMTLLASFRIMREGPYEGFGDGPEDPFRSPVIVVTWPGSRVSGHVPKRYEREQRRRRQSRR